MTHNNDPVSLYHHHSLLAYPTTVSREYGTTPLEVHGEDSD